MSTPCIIAKVNKDNSINAIAIRHDGYLDSVGRIIRKLNRDQVEQILNCPYNEISSIVTKEDMKHSLLEFPEYHDVADYEQIKDTNFFMHFYGKGDQTLPQIHQTKDNTTYHDLDDLLENAGYLEDWYAMYLFKDEHWQYKKFNDKNFRTLK